MTESSLRLQVGTRNSHLALVQARAALDRLHERLPAVCFDLIEASSPGDRDRVMDLQASPEDFFTRDLDDAVLSGALDAAIHSAKDVPPHPRDGLDWCWLPEPADPRDVLILRRGETTADWPDEPRIGVSSERRVSWCETQLPQAALLPIRGNIEDRLAQLDAGAFDAILMAGCALLRLGLEDRITEWIPLAELPTPEGQGSLAITFRAGDARFTRLRSLFMKAVAFVGAGVGDAHLCTVAGVAALQQCDVCLHDTLMDPALLAHCPPDAVVVDVGKRAGAHTVPQQDTTQMLCDYARRGRRVVRLKGGDPCIFGRLAEEVEALDALQLPYRVLPGISSLSVMGASTGILMTRRGVSNGFSIITGRGEGGAITSLDATDRLHLPLVLFMAISAWPELKAQLVEEGLSGDTPAAVVLNAGSPVEQVLRGRVATLADDMAAPLAELPGRPAGLIVVGDVARYGFSRDGGALQGRRVLLTCSAALQDEAQREVLDAGGRPLALPLIQLLPGPAAAEAAAVANAYDWLVVTSPSAVRCLLAGVHEGAGDVRRLPPIMACGPGTLRELHAAGLTPDAVPARGFGAEGLLPLAKARMAPGARVLRVRSDKAGPGLASQLRAQGVEVDDVCIYRNVSTGQTTLPAFDTVFFASSSAVEVFMAQWGLEALASREVLAIGQPTARALRDAGCNDLLVSPEATVRDAMAHLAAASVLRAVCAQAAAAPVG
ncbi:MAG: uroporphyrinogen-III C-methyltransferase [Verrucomicrobia bacterium]|jgi:uroporphyrinogen III methyltransferase / synthase|nr:uroporphyrinogen-III C-methyltransferase [Verrucomicrobiota bacterium]MBT7067223.1 uroporphyrinogen-III C-methyltransferase [Verrucomicrobiota bacterium]MBT7699004.1 uroporphyrinogen-III C-methyltransferase [Verrucomicrobiota bacterium]